MDHKKLRKTRVYRLILLIYLGFISCDTTRESPTIINPRNCVFAIIDDISITLQDAYNLASLMHPPPSQDKIIRLTIDAALAQSYYKHLSPDNDAKKQFQDYRAFVDEHSQGKNITEGINAMRTQLQLLNTSQRFEYGPCYSLSS